MTTAPTRPGGTAEPPAPGYVAAEPRVDSRPRARRLLAPVATALGVVAATGVIRVVDPNEPGHYPMCPTMAIFGIDCPGCGGLRATHALAHGDIAAALDHNALFVVMVPLLVGLWVMWMYRAWTGITPALTRRREIVARTAPMIVLIVVMVFAVVRNFVPFLPSGVG